MVPGRQSGEWVAHKKSRRVDQEDGEEAHDQVAQKRLLARGGE